MIFQSTNHTNTANGYEFTKSTKFQAPNHKQTTMTKIQSTKQNAFGTLVFGISVLFGIWNLGFVICHSPYIVTVRILV
ncbi:hypothetical protein A2673_01870 [Candidatus Kaiserbacteria bacterium RIFCSPHIGHO2_01_FULL_50_13]|uniref:Uncharacterized protein n=1 Tax=Candidatus Kaiserbacteria bacterium RIFCSPLOWO2_01_FULL_50_24 TaxID=1798507 RepID=A0A1F6EII0_9BACT|nr:MAG: hypothetical protein A2673_01870 [Candidatus Kaiserbacteria bacterium RIFCSPHIGHO2_01_FULL_50_13]OGG73429.1 MAG: hypothetical protein A3A34_02405 [Candidatus Kaiserbacteria bacterium RIFCSPLOWO2_01_FULL_50_24]OGG81312.1 MAG: hypothetical protein A3H74_02000 [Candidatus Kaiserbacteria bacterium RIFCSPLOWO2_02_FULL_51_13]